MTGSAGGATDGAGAPWLQPVRDASGTPWLEPVSAPSAWSAADLERDRSWVYELSARHSPGARRSARVAALRGRAPAYGCKRHRDNMKLMTEEVGAGRRKHGMLSLDSSPEMERLQIDLWRRMSPLEKARAVDGLSLATQELALAGIRQRHPQASERECLLRLAMLKLGPRLAVQVYPESADLLDS